MENGQTTLTELSSEISGLDQVRFRVALVKTDTEWNLLAAVVDNLPDSGPLPWTSYDYGQVAFIAGALRGAEFVDWLNLRKGNADHYEFKIPPPQSLTNWHRYPSHTRYGYIGAGVPFTNYQLHGPQDRPQVPNNLGFLVSDTSPFFPDFDTAIWQLLFDTVDQNRAGTLPSELIVVRLADKCGWIDALHISPTAMTVQVIGDEIQGTRLEVWPPLNFWTSKIIESAGEVAIPLSSGVPMGTWVVLSKGQKVLDYRQLPPSAYGPTIDNLTLEIDTATRLEQLIYRGEGETIEFKREIPQRHEVFLKTVAAFANGQGGTVIIGVDKDEDRTIVGVSEPVSKLKDRITQMVNDNLVPVPRVQVSDVEVNGKLLVAIDVERGLIPPYGLNANRPIFYVRRGGTTFAARQDEVRALALSGQSGNSYVRNLLG